MAKEVKKGVDLRPLINCDNCIYFEDTGKGTMFCKKIKTACIQRPHRCIYKKLEK